jgi:signal transduction histidine kinase
VEGQPIGILYLDNRLKTGQFQEEDLALATAIADQAALALRNAQQHTRKCQVAIEQERHRLARDLHDSVAQSLYSIAIGAQTALKLLDQVDADRRVRDLIQQIQDTSHAALTEMREHLYCLHPNALADHGLVEALAQHCEAVRKRYSLAVELKINPEPRLSVCEEESLYWVAREALQNIIKHSAATRVVVMLAQQKDETVLSVIDNGVGFDPAMVEHEETIGLRSMRERLKLVEGSLELESRQGVGTRVTARIPLGAVEGCGQEAKRDGANSRLNRR